MKKNLINQNHFAPVSILTVFCLVILSLSVITTFSAIAQPDSVYVQSDIPPGEGNLNSAIKAIRDKSSLSNTIFILESNGYYVLTDSILVPAGEHLTIIAPRPGTTQEKGPPQIVCTSDTGTRGIYSSPVRYMFYILGDLTLRNIWLLYANTNGRQVSTAIIFYDDPNNIIKHRCNLDGVVVDYSSVPILYGGAITVACKNFSGTFKNSYWKNCADKHFRYYGRAVSFPFENNTISDWHIDSLIFENCTFANIGYVYMQENTHYADYVKFNHCTFLNVVLYSLESGWWNKLAVTNSIFVNTFMDGDIPFTHEYKPPFSFNEPMGGTLRIDSVSTFGFAVPFNDQDRRILFAHSSYYIEKWLSDWMYYNPGSALLRECGETNLIQRPQPMINSTTINFFESHNGNGKKVFPFMNKAALYNFSDPGFILSPTDSAAIKAFLYDKWYTGGADYGWAWKPENSISRLWPLEENLAYTNDTLKTAGMGGFPLGDLYHWWHNEYSRWKIQEKDENARIADWLNTGLDTVITEVNSPSGSIYKFELSQNYPNPFNPVTKIRYFVPKVGTYGNASIQINVYDILGRKIAVLVNKMQRPGNYEVTFDGIGLVSGIYFYKLSVGNFSKVKKMILLK